MPVLRWINYLLSLFIIIFTQLLPPSRSPVPLLPHNQSHSVHQQQQQQQQNEQDPHQGRPCDPGSLKRNMTTGELLEPGKVTFQINSPNSGLVDFCQTLLTFASLSLFLIQSNLKTSFLDWKLSLRFHFKKRNLNLQVVLAIWSKYRGSSYNTVLL